MSIIESKFRAIYRRSESRIADVEVEVAIIDKIKCSRNNNDSYLAKVTKCDKSPDLVTKVVILNPDDLIASI